MKLKFSVLAVLLFISATMFAQTPVTPANLPKDAKIDVTVHDDKNDKPLQNEIVIFKSQINGTEYQGQTDAGGKFSLRLPAGDKYDYFILGFHDSLQNNVLDIPALGPNKYYSKPFTIDISFTPASSFVIQGCNFETGKAALEEESFAVLDELVSYLQRKENEVIEIDGYTDNVGKAADNLVLSQNRANTVRDYLVSKGIAATRVSAKGFGMSNPVDDNKTAEGRANNRRIEVKTLSTDN
ncbi:OmpA family protein [Ferruginibacter albus]|uniref:OmpA family protein n=1 Tax=Ferruginibacter albus TaxID=2875540 RepID=UPI001CC7D857|nr:OmpA family protein [Ferruginibacter albus]UAY51388.1 OmpA family protein [Ferruginibacter albus]